MSAEYKIYVDEGQSVDREQIDFVAEHVRRRAKWLAKYEDNRVMHWYGIAHVGDCPVCEQEAQHENTNR
jgi:hypothetical protein